MLRIRIQGVKYQPELLLKKRDYNNFFIFNGLSSFKKDKNKRKKYLKNWKIIFLFKKKFSKS